jgi:hypothetical protein
MRTMLWILSVKEYIKKRKPSSGTFGWMTKLEKEVEEETGEEEKAAKEEDNIA